jgi:threonine/homoserine/homoserine lactone efflux protein
MRARDVRAIAFWITSSLVLLTGVFLATHGVIAAVALTGAYNAWLLTRPRMRRVFRRMRGETSGFSGYYLD